MECGVRSVVCVKCRVWWSLWSLECGVRSVKCKVWSVECKVWSVKCMECGV